MEKRVGMFGMFGVFQLLRSCEKLEAFRNMYIMSVTLLVSHEEMS